MGRELLAGLDVGTTSVKALLLTSAGEEVAVGRVATPWTITGSGAETSAESLLDAARRALADALAQRPDDRVTAVGIASMAEAGVLVGSDDVPLAPVIAWHDHRDEAEMEDLVAHLGAETFSVRTGLPVWTQWSLTKHRWLVDHVPAARRATRRYNIAEWVARGLGGDPVTELSLASRTGGSTCRRSSHGARRWRGRVRRKASWATWSSPGHPPGPPTPPAACAPWTVRR